MLTECVFIVIIFSTYLTWHSKYLFPKRETAKSKTKVEPSQINLEYHEASIKKRIKTISKVKSWHVFCAWTLTLQPRPLLFCPPSRPPTAEARTRTFSLSTSPTTSILRIPTQVPQGFWRLLQWTCKPSLCPGRGWGCKFFALEFSLTAIWVPCVVGKKPRMFLVIALFSRLGCCGNPFPLQVTSQISYKSEPSCSSLRQMPPGQILEKPTPPPFVQVLMSASISAQIVSLSALITVSALAMTTIPSSLQYSYNWSPSSQSSPTNYISCRAIQNSPGSRKLPSPAVHPTTKMRAIVDDLYTNEKKTTEFVIHLLNNSRWLGALIWPQCAIFWPSLAPPADLVEFWWFNMAGTGVPHIVLHVLGSTCTSGGYFRPKKSVLSK